LGTGSQGLVTCDQANSIEKGKESATQKFAICTSVKPYPWTSPQEDLAAARKLIEQCGYWRRKEELEDAEAAAKNW
jgi:hypothetical protein